MDEINKMNPWQPITEEDGCMPVDTAFQIHFRVSPYFVIAKCNCCRQGRHKTWYIEQPGKDGVTICTSQAEVRRLCDYWMPFFVMPNMQENRHDAILEQALRIVRLRVRISTFEEIEATKPGSHYQLTIAAGNENRLKLCKGDKSERKNDYVPLKEPEIIRITCRGCGQQRQRDFRCVGITRVLNEGHLTAFCITLTPLETADDTK